MKLAELAARIDAHLTRIEADPEINVDLNGRGLHRFYNAHAWHGGKYVRVNYISYQHPMTLDRAEAERYLAWLDAGNSGKHHEANRAAQAEAAADDPRGLGDGLGG